MESHITYERISLKRYKRRWWYLYIVLTDKPWNAYVGITTNPVRRLREHLEGKRSYYTRKFGLRCMHVVTGFPTYKSARLAEREIHTELGVTLLRT